jgi:hypothetical protein
MLGGRNKWHPDRLAGMVAHTLGETRHVPSGSSSVGRAAAFQAACREFEPRLPLQSRPDARGVALGAACIPRPYRPRWSAAWPGGSWCAPDDHDGDRSWICGASGAHMGQAGPNLAGCVSDMVATCTPRPRSPAEGPGSDAETLGQRRALQASCGDPLGRREFALGLAIDCQLGEPMPSGDASKSGNGLPHSA